MSRVPGQRRSLDPVKYCAEPGCTSRADHYRVGGKLFCKRHGQARAFAKTQATKNQGLAKTGVMPPPLLPLTSLPVTYTWQGQTINLRERPQKKDYETLPDWALASQNWIRAGADFFKDIILMKRKMPADWTTSERIGRSYIAFVEHFLVTPGMDSSKQFIMSPYCRDFFIAAFSTRDDDDQMIRYRSGCIMSVAKKNKKTTSLSGILAAQVLIAPWPDMNLMIGAPTKVGSECYGMTRKWLDRTPGCTAKTPGVMGDVPPLVVWTTSAKIELSMRRNPRTYLDEHSAELFCVGDNTSQQLSSAPRGCATLDELGRMPDDRMFRALRNSLRAAPLSPLIVISIRGNEDSPLVAILEQQQRRQDPNMLVVEHSGSGEPPYSDAAILAANPTIGEPGGPLMEDLRATAQEAQDQPGLRADYYRETLNVAANVYTTERVLTEYAYEQGIGEAILEGPVTLGLDLSQSRDAAALALYDKRTGGLQVHTFLPGEPSLETRAQADRVPYTNWADLSHFHLTADSGLIAYEEIVYLIDEILHTYGAEEMYVDPHLYNIFSKVVENIARTERRGLMERWPQVFPVIGSAGNKKGDHVHISSFVDSFRETAAAGNMLHGEDPIFTHAIKQTLLRKNIAGQASVAKNTKKGLPVFNDACTASILAVGGREAFENASTPLPTADILAQEKFVASLPDPTPVTAPASLHAMPIPDAPEEEEEYGDMADATRAGVMEYLRERGA